MVKSSHTSFPEEGVGLYVSAEDALACGIKPGDPAVVEVTVRPHTIQEWMTEAQELASQTEHDPGPGVPSGPASVTETPDTSASDSDADQTIRWRSADLAPVGVKAEPVKAEPISEEAVEDHTRIRWRSA